MNNRKFLNCLAVQNQRIFKQQAKSGLTYCHSSDKSRHFHNVVICVSDRIAACVHVLTLSFFFFLLRLP